MILVLLLPFQIKVYIPNVLVLTLVFQIKVYFPNGLDVRGTLQYCNLQYNIAVVPDFCPLNTYNPVPAEIGCKVVAVGRVFNSGRVTSSSGIITGKDSNLNCDKLMVSTCKITMVHCLFPLLFFYVMAINRCTGIAT